MKAWYCRSESRRQFRRMRPVEGRVGLSDKPARRIGRFHRALFDAHLQGSEAPRRASLTGTVRPSGRSTNIESASSAAEESMTVLNVTTAVQWARSRAHFRTSQVHRGVWQLHASTSPPPGQKWPERHRSLSEPLGRRFRPYVRSLEPRARPDRSKWLHVSPAESVMLSSCSLLQLSPQGGAEKGGMEPNLGCPLKFTHRRSRGAIGRYQRPTGALPVAPGVPRRPMDGADGFPGVGKGLKLWRGARDG